MGDDQRASELDETPARDHALIVGMAALQAVPIIGGVVATFISEYVPRKKQERLVEFVKAEYHYVLSDLHNIGILMVIMAVLLGVAMVAFNARGMGPN